MENPEEEEGFAGVCRFCGTDCGGVSQLFDENAKLCAENAALLAKIAQREEDDYNRRAEKPQ